MSSTNMYLLKITFLLFMFKLLGNCQNVDVFLIFVCWKDFNRQRFKNKNRYYIPSLLNEKDEKTKYLKTLKTLLMQQEK